MIWINFANLKKLQIKYWNCEIITLKYELSSHHEPMQDALVPSVTAQRDVESSETKSSTVQKDTTV